MNENTPSTAVVVVCLLILGALAGWFARDALDRGAATAPVEGAPPVPDRVQPDIFFVVIDTLRADHLPAYGSQRMTAPWLTELAQRSHVFNAATATAPWTVPSVASYFTGLLPEQHGLSRAPSITSEAGSVEIMALPEEAVTLAERLKAAGYRTYAVVANAHMPPGSGFDRGFDQYLCVGFKRAPRVQLAVERLAAEIRRRREPVFVYVHYFDPHDPYTRFVPVVYSFKQDLDEYQDRRARDPSLGEVDRRPLQKLLMEDLLQREDLRVGGSGLPYLEALYDSEIRLCDDHVQLLYGDLGIDDGDVVVVTADHGEEFRDHGELGHRVNLYEETLRVPLMISWPAVWRTPRRIQERVSLVDLAPTLAEIGGAPVTEEEIRGQSLLSLLDGEGWEQAFPVTAELVRTDGLHLRAIYDGAMKLVVDVERPEHMELYDLDADPGETQDLAPLRQEYARALAGALQQHLADAPALRPAVLETRPPEEVMRQLEGMGYLEGGDGAPAER